MNTTTKILILFFTFCYLFTSIGCKSKTDFSPYADGSYTAEESHSHSHEHDEHEHDHDDD